MEPIEYSECYDMGMTLTLSQAWKTEWYGVIDSNTPTRLRWAQTLPSKPDDNVYCV